MDDGWDYPAPFLRRCVVEAADIDGLAHTNNTVYVRWCEACAWEHSTSLGLDVAAYQRLDRAMAVVEGRYEYLQASHEGDEIITATWISSWDKRLTMKRHFQVRRGDGTTLLRAQQRFVCIEISTGKPRRLPREFIDGYGPAVMSGDGATR